MKYYGLSAAFLRDVGHLSWGEVLWAFDQGLLGWTDAVELARSSSLRSKQASEAQDDLSNVDKSRAHEVRELILELAALEPISDTSEIKAKWLRLLLDWVLRNKSQYPDPLGEVEAIYAEFGYPSEIEGFVRYMPPSDGYDPARYSATENMDRLFRLWGEFVGQLRRS